MRRDEEKRRPWRLRRWRRCRWRRHGRILFQSLLGRRRCRCKRREGTSAELTWLLVRLEWEKGVAPERGGSPGGGSAKATAGSREGDFASAPLPSRPPTPTPSSAQERSSRKGADPTEFSGFPRDLVQVCI